MRKIFGLSTSLLILVAFLFACESPKSSNVAAENQNAGVGALAPIDSSQAIAEYVVDLFDDSKGNLWMGTVEEGVARWDGKKLQYFGMADGLPDKSVVAFAQATNDGIWMGTHNGLAYWDGQTFKNYSEKDGLIDNRVSCLLVDRNGALWVGTWAGLCKFKAGKFEEVKLPVPKFDTPDFLNTSEWVTRMVEDQDGRIWVGRDGYGLTVFDGKKVDIFGKENGLLSTCVHAMAFGPEGELWVGCRVAERDHPDPKMRQGFGGAYRWDGQQFRSLDATPNLDQTDIYAMYNDAEGNVFVGANGRGLYQFSPDGLKIFEGTNRMDLTYSVGIQSILKDRKGQVWLGMSGGLFRLENGKLRHFWKR